jgi:hypothetical protein
MKKWVSVIDVCDHTDIMMAGKPHIVPSCVIIMIINARVLTYKSKREEGWGLLIAMENFVNHRNLFHCFGETDLGKDDLHYQYWGISIHNLQHFYSDINSHH